jgi:DNA-damage-inducible protein J
MAKTVLNVKTDKEVKEEAQKLARELGIPLSTVVNAYLKEFVREQRVEFSRIPKMTTRLERLLDGVEQDIKESKNLSPVFSSTKEMDEYLDSV